MYAVDYGDKYVCDYCYCNTKVEGAGGGGGGARLYT